jgi:hypothetical protein
MAQQLIFGNTPNNNWIAVDNGASPTFPTVDITNTQLGYDNKNMQAGTYSQPNPGAVTQGANAYANTGTTPLDINGNDTIIPQPRISTFPGNPNLGTAPTFSKVTTVINSALTGICIGFKNPAILLF